MKRTRKQELYFDELLEQVDRGQVVTVKETARKLHIARQTVSRWHADQTFRAAASKILRESNNDLWDHLVDRAVARKAIQGSAKHAELNLRRRGLYDPVPPELPLEPPPGGDGVKVGVHVQFVGLPTPPTPQQAEAMRPPPGSAMVVTAAGVLEDRSRKDRKP